MIAQEDQLNALQRPLYGGYLLHEIDTVHILLDHALHALQMTCGALQALDRITFQIRQHPLPPPPPLPGWVIKRTVHPDVAIRKNCSLTSGHAAPTSRKESPPIPEWGRTRGGSSPGSRATFTEDWLRIHGGHPRLDNDPTRLFANTPQGVRASAVVYSLVETVKENGLDPQRYLEHVLTQLPNLEPEDKAGLEELLPWSVALPQEVRGTR